MSSPEWPSTEMTTVYLYLFDGVNLSLLETTALGFLLVLFPKKITKEGYKFLSLHLGLESLIGTHLPPLLPILDFSQPV